MLNAKKNARTVGFLLIILGIIDVVGNIKTLTNFIGGGNSLIGEDILSFTIMVAGPIIAIVGGYGLFKTKLWGIYGLALFILVRIGTLIWAASSQTITTGNYITLGIYILLFIWFYSGKKHFIK